MLRTNHSLIIASLLLLASSCGIQITTLDGGARLHGSVPSLVGKVTSLERNSFHAYAANCSAFVDLIQLDQDDQPVYPSIASAPVKPDGTFDFGKSEHLLSEKVDHILEVRTEGTCDALLQRPLTHIKNPQIITPFSTVVAAAKDAQFQKRLIEISKTDMEKLLQENINISSHKEAYQKLLENSSEFKSLFGEIPTKLETSAPIVQETIFPGELINEGSVNNLRIMATHWSPDYKMVVQWKLDGVTKAQLSQWSFIPNANSQGTHQLEVYVGADDGSGKIDSSKPYHYYSKVFRIANSILPSPPQLNLANTLVNTTDVTIRLLTGAGMINCESFSSLAVTVDDETVPVSFLQDCTTPNSQDLNVSIPSGDGVKTIRVWARDNEGVISSLASSLQLTLDQTPPALAVTSPSGTLRGGSSITLPVSASDVSGIASFQLFYSTDNGVSYNLISGLTGSTTSYNWTLPNVDSAQVRLKLTAQDSLGNSSESASPAFIIDSTAPAKPVVTLTSGSPTNTVNFTISIPGCADYSSVLISETSTKPALNATTWEACSNSLAGVLSSTTSGDRSVYLHARDVAGNISTSDAVVIKLDQTPPTLVFNNSFDSIYKAGNAIGINWTASDANFGTTPIKIEYTADQGLSWNTILSSTSNDGNESWNIPAVDAPDVRIKITATDLAGNSTSILSTSFGIESSIPSITAFSVNNNSGESPVYGNMTLEGNSTIANITHFCFKTAHTTKPLATDACWTAVNSPQPGLSPAKLIQFSNYGQMISFTPGPTTVSAWIKTAVDNISDALTVNVNVVAPNPPVVSSILVANISSPSDPVIASEKTFNGTQKAYIKWKVTSKTPSAISILYNTNTGSTLVASNLINGSNGGCVVNDTTTADDSATGCYEMNNAPSQYFSITIRATDQDGISSQGTSYPLNATRIKVLAGNTDLGLNTSALTSIHRIASGWSDPGSLIVTTKGRIFYRDLTMGLVSVDPKDGIVKLVMPITGVSSGDGGPAINGTLNFPSRMALDYQDRLLIFDKTRIRRINTNVDPMTVETIIGSTPTSTADGTLASNFQLIAPSWNEAGHDGSKTIPFFALPNGDIFFGHGTFNTTISAGVKIYRYKASEGKIYSITPSGTGHAENASANIQGINVYGFGVTFNPNTSEITRMHLRLTQSYVGDSGWVVSNLDPTTYIATAPHPAKAGLNDYQIQGMDGKLYVHNARAGSLLRFEPDTNTWTTLAGGGSDPACPDLALATTCQLGYIKPAAFFISASGQVYFTDRFGIVRVVLADKTVRRIMGQSKNAGDGGLASEARLNSVSWVDQADDGMIFFSDTVESKIRKFNIDGLINAHANTVAANLDTIHLNRTTKEIYSYTTQNSIYKLPYASPVWASLGAPTISYDSKNNYIVGIWGFDGSSNLLYMLNPLWNATDGYRDYKLGNFNITTQAKTLVTGYIGTSTTFAAHGTLAANASISTTQVRAQYDSSTTPHRWLMLASGTNRIVSLNKDGMANNESLLTFTTLPLAANSFIYRRATNNDEIIDYCGTDKKLHSYNITTATATNYAWPITALECSGKTINYNAARNSLIFPARMNNLSSVVEYQLD